MRRLLRPRTLAAAAAALLCLAVAAPPIVARLATRGERYGSPADVPAEPVAIVFGAGLAGNGRLTAILRQRVDGGIALYRLGRVGKLLMTGDNSRPGYNEVAAMRRYAVEHGVPARDITLDYAGFSTYDSCYRAPRIFGVRRAVLVTQAFHLPRALYTCRRLGVDAVGLALPDWGRYSTGTMLHLSLREALATGKALWDVDVTRPLPRFLGPYVGMRPNG